MQSRHRPASPLAEPGPAAYDAVDRIFREESGRVLAGLIRVVGDIDLAEESVQDAFIAALEHWPREGLPPNPGAWIATTARNRAIDRLRRAKKLTEKTDALGRLMVNASAAQEPGPEMLTDRPAVEDDRLRLIFTCCHPALAADAQIALTLRLLGGLRTPEIARAFLLPEATLAQRLVRAKKKIRDAAIPYVVPEASELPARLGSVLHVLYLVFNEGYSASSGSTVVRRELASESIRLARVLAQLMPAEPEVVGLLALLLLQDSRRDARQDERGDLVLLADQDRSRWDAARISEGLALLDRAARMGSRGSYLLQASIAAEHARAGTAVDTDWVRIVAFYDELLAAQPSPVIALNRAVAVSMASGPAAGLALVDAIAASGDLAEYHLLHSARGELLRRSGRLEDARVALTRARDLATNDVDRRHLDRRLRELAS
ncbi:MAG: polymerase sigma-70 factor, subfamily [Chloroflexota bacterium]|jgi:RNA polymerase sigma-70 factor (ECF subfamily)|nr:polymerase sigma-70 factor, subfamily [Chloroflexota bacterium]